MFEFCLPTRATAVPSGPDWLHEIKYDGYRLRLERDGDRVRLITRGGYNWADRYPWIVETARDRSAASALDTSLTNASLILSPYGFLGYTVEQRRIAHCMGQEQCTLYSARKNQGTLLRLAYPLSSEG
jgi:hypothetical protein